MNIMGCALLGAGLLEGLGGPLLGCAQEVAPTAVQIGAALQPSTFAYRKGENTALGATLRALLSDPAVAQAHWGIAVTAMDGTPLYGLDEGKLFHPASTAKLFTTAAAMAILGPEHIVNTTITGSLDASTGVVQGDLRLVGAGDPSFNTEDLPYRRTTAPSAASNDLTHLADQLVALGVHRITGNVVGDDTLFAHEPPPEGWAAEDLLWGYGALPSALSIGDNELRLTVSPGAVHLPVASGPTAGAMTQLDQLAPYMTVHDDVVTVESHTKPQTGIGIVTEPEHPRTFEVFGSIAEGALPVVEHLAVPDAAQYAAEALRERLVQQGVQVDGNAQALHASNHSTEPYLVSLRKPDDCAAAMMGKPGAMCSPACPVAPPTSMLATHPSATLREEVVFTLKTSANLHAELLLHQLGLQANPCPGTSAVHGARIVRTWLLHNGFQAEDFVFYDGSGLSTKDLVTPRAEAQLLALAARQPWFALWKAALPVGGVDGTLASRFSEAPLKGHVLAKTGTLGESRALAGYVVCASGREAIFAVLDDNHVPGNSADRVVMDRIVAAIAASL